MTQRSAPAILGLGTAQPEFSMSQDEAVSLAHDTFCRDDEQRRLVKALYRKSGVKNRQTCLPHQVAREWTVPPPHFLEPSAVSGIASVTGDGEQRSLAELVEVALAEVEPIEQRGPTTSQRMEMFRDTAPAVGLRAAAAALADARVDPATITHLVCVSCTGFFAPGIDIPLINGLGLPPTVGRIQVGFMGCHGAINGLRAAHALAAADPRNRVLLCAVELCSLHYCMEWDPARAVGNAVFADGAAALVIGQADAKDSHDQTIRVAATGSCIVPDSADAMSWTIGDHGFEMFLSSRVPDLIAGNLRPWFDEWLASNGLKLADIGSWAVHPGGPRILNAVEETLELKPEQLAVSREVLSECGNMSSPTVLFILERLRARGAAMPCVALGFGPGLAAEAALFT